MSYLSGSQNVQKSMNGLLKITATEIDVDTATINTINGLQTIEVEVGENLVISSDVGNNIQFNADVLINRDLDVIGTTTLDDLIINGNTNINNLTVSGNTNLNTLNVSGKSNFTGDASFNSMLQLNNLNVTGKSNFVGDASFNSMLQLNNLNVNGTSKFFNDASFTRVVQLSTLNVTGKSNFANDASFNSMLQLNNLNVTGKSNFTGDASFNSMLQLNTLNVTGKSKFSNDASLNGLLDITGQMNIRDPTNTSNYIRFYHDIAQYGYIFQLETPNQIMYFKVKNGTTPGQYKTFYFAASQLYANMLTYIDNWLTVSYNNLIVLGDANSAGAWNGGSIKYIPNSAETSGLVFFNKGNNTTYYTNFTHNNLSNVEVPTLRMNYANIWSKVKHTFELDASMNGNLVVNGNSTFNNSVTFNSSFNAQSTTLSSLTVTGNITQSGTTATTNKLTQSIVLGDVTGNPNTLKYTQFKINSNSATGTPHPVCLMIDDFNSRGIQFISNASSSALNPLVALNDSVIGPLVLNNSSLVLTNFGSIKSGLKISTTASTNANVELHCKDSYIKMNSSSALQSLDISTEILNHTATSGYQLTSPEVFIQTTNDLYPCKYRALTHEFSKKDGTNGCTVNIKGNITLPVASTGITFPSGQVQTDAWNSTNAGYTKSGTTISFANNTNLTLTTGGQMTFANGTIQTTAFRTDDNTKLQAIGTVTTSTLSATTTLTSGSFFNCGSMTLSGGTYMVTLNCCMAVITGSTTVSQLLMGLSTSATGLSTNNHLSIIHAGTITYNIGNQWVLTTSAIIEVALSTTYRMVCQPSFGTASRLQFNSTNSFFRAVRIG
jgi:hypothetical protein